MKLVGVISTAVLSLALGVAAPAFAQDQHDQDDKSKPAAQEEKKAQPEKSVKPEEKNAQQDKNVKPEEKNAQQDRNVKPEEKNAQQERQPAGNNGGGRIPDAKYQANFGRQHTFHVSQGDYSNRRFQYGGYTFGFAGAWPSNWLYTQDVYVIEINGVYYLCNPSYPGVNIQLSFAP
jgi:hypothetical protein